jgi:hypothetical protein
MPAGARCSVSDVGLHIVGSGSTKHSTSAVALLVMHAANSVSGGSNWRQGIAHVKCEVVWLLSGRLRRGSYWKPSPSTATICSV